LDNRDNFGERKTHESFHDGINVFGGNVHGLDPPAKFTSEDLFPDDRR
jgi:hypothetical protein